MAPQPYFAGGWPLKAVSCKAEEAWLSPRSSASPPCSAVSMLIGFPVLRSSPEAPSGETSGLRQAELWEHLTVVKLVSPTVQPETPLPLSQPSRPTSPPRLWREKRA